MAQVSDEKGKEPQLVAHLSSNQAMQRRDVKERGEVAASTVLRSGRSGKVSVSKEDALCWMIGECWHKCAGKDPTSD